MWRSIATFLIGGIFGTGFNVDLSDYHSAVIWCAEFGVLISPADLGV